MNDYIDNQLNKKNDGEIDLGDLFYVLWNKKLFIGASTFIFTIAFVAYSFMLPNIYKSEAIMMPVETNSGMSGMLGQYSSMASLAGISLPSESGSKSQEAIARVKSFDFFENYFLSNIKLENFMAIKKWNRQNNTLIYDENDFNTDLGKWVRKAKSPRSTIPSSQEAYEKYLEVMNIVEDKKTLFVSLSIKHESPILAKKWVDLIINQIDLVMRDEDKQEAIRSIEYLNSIAPTVNYEEIKKALTSLTQEQMKQLMVVEASENYVFKVLDSALVPEIKSEPGRVLISILGTLLGLVVGVILSLILYYKR
jgi:LPS O-antigen subunit length determinant protein (WzzB/FepE family)